MGELDKTGSFGSFTSEDLESPIPNDLIAEGKEVIGTMLSGQEARAETGPWTKYQAAGNVSGAGPWDKYAKAERSPSETFLNRGIATTMGAPVDVANAALSLVGLDSDEPVGGSRWIESMMRAAAPQIVPREGEEPETLGARIARGTGEAAGGLLPFGTAMQALKGAGGVTGRVAKAASDTAVRRPFATMAAEAGAGAGAGAGGYIASESNPDNPEAEVLGEIAGGIAASVAPGAIIGTAKRTPVVGTAIRAAKGAVAPFTDAGARVRATNRLRELTADPENLAKDLSQDTIGNLTPAQQSGEPRLMALERAILDQDAKLENELSERSAESIRQLREAITQMGEGGTAETTRGFVEQRLSRLTSALQGRLAQAQGIARAKLDALKPEQRRTEASVIVRDELEKALSDARAQEREFWSQVPSDTEVSTESARATYMALKDDLPRAQRDDIPEVADRFLDSTSNQKLGDVDTVKELQGLRSALLEQSRKARAAGELNTARIADGIADAILDDMSAADGGDALATARAFSRDLNERFKQGAVGRVLGYAREGGSKVAPESTLDTTVGRGGVRGAVETDEVMRALESSPAQGKRSVEQYLRNRFLATLDNGKVNPDKLAKFVRDNEEMLDRFPGFKQQLQDLEQAQQFANRLQRTTDARVKALQSPSVSRAAMFLNARPEEEIDAILRSKDPVAAAREIRRQVAKDQTGEARRGLKAAFLDYLERRSATGKFTGEEHPQPILGGRAMTATLSDGKVQAVANEILSTEEMSRLRQITQELSKIETSSGRLPDVGKPMEDTPSTIIRFIGQTMAARSGAKLGQGTSGASLLTANFASQRVRRLLQNLTNDRAAELLKDAVQDKQLFRGLLLDLDRPINVKVTNQRLNSWLAGPGNRVVPEEGEDRDETDQNIRK